MSFWHRLEPNTADEDLAESVQARIADPLWALARQWQLGEFKGEDAASPVHVRAAWSVNPIDTFRNDAEPRASVEPFEAGQPLQSRVEAESVLDGPAAVMLAAEAGLQFVRRLDLAGLGTLRSSVDWPAMAGFDLAAEGIDVALLPERERARLDLIGRHGIDGRRIQRLGADGVARLVPAAGSDRYRVRTVFEAWLAAYSGRFAQPSASGDCWTDERFEYQFSLGVSTGAGEVVLRADEYPGGHLDWYTFRIAPNTTHGLGVREPRRQQLELLPQPVMFAGQGAARWWEFEDRTVYFGNLAAGPADVARLAVAEFGTVFSDDWYIVPVGVPTGTLCRVDAVEVVDVFGDTTRIDATAVNDHRRYGHGRPFRYFELDGDHSAEQGASPWLLVLPMLPDVRSGEPVERVSLVRDEQANLGWAIEQCIELPTGATMRRRHQWRVRSGEARREADMWRYRLQAPVPPWWVPFVPEPTGQGAQMRLRRSRMQAWSDLDPALVGAKGRLVGMARPLRVYEEEVDRGGIEVVRQWRRARAADGRVVVWMARRRRPGRSGRGSGLSFDSIQRADAR